MPNAETSQGAAAPLETDEIDAILAPLRRHDRLLLAVSGGADSLALMILCAEWQQRCNSSPDLIVASVDHGLRPEAAGECAYVAEVAKRQGLSHTILEWREKPSGANLQAQARQARYRLLADHTYEQNCSAIVLAHHLDDQAETLVMRLLRGSGVTGLCAMHDEQPYETLNLVRPLIDVPKARLKASLSARGVDWIEDPSNANKDYLRVRVRDLMPLLAEEGCDASRLAATARRMQRADAALNKITQDAFRDCMRREPGRALSFEVSSYSEQLEEVRLRLCRLMLNEVAGPAYPPREERLLALDGALCEANRGSFAKRTIGGCCFEWAGGRLWVYREPGRVQDSLPLAAKGFTDWQGLFDMMLIEAPSFGVGQPRVRVLGIEGRMLLRQAGISFPLERWGGEGTPSALIEALPAIWWGELPQFVVDWPEVSQKTGVEVVVKEKSTKLMS